jgi:chromosome segregation ATPase
MASVISTLIEDLESLLESHSEYADVIDDGNIEARHLHDEIGRDLHRLRRTLKTLAKQNPLEADDVEEMEESLAELEDAMAELAATL